MMNDFVDRINDKLAQIEVCEELSQEKIWLTHRNVIWKTKRFVGLPVFYPVYKYNDLYSYDIIPLILKKGYLKLNHQVAHDVSKDNFIYFSGKNTVDREITRLGGFQTPLFKINDTSDYVRGLAEAMLLDISEIENRHAGYTNIILCGGKDSLNMLLLSWKNPVIVASAQPNYDLVVKFIKDNDLKYDVVNLEDHDKTSLNLEILINACRNNLEHCRWGYHLQKLSDSLNKKVIFWKGQLADTFTTPRWKTYVTLQSKMSHNMSRIIKRLNEYSNDLVDKSTITQRYYFRCLWHRGAMWQGAHMSIIRQLTDSLVLSGYHGPAVQKILSEVNLYHAVTEDIRPKIGEYLYGGKVLYPAINPGPAPSEIRRNISHIEPFLKMINLIHLPIL